MTCKATNRLLVLIRSVAAQATAHGGPDLGRDDDRADAEVAQFLRQVLLHPRTVRAAARAARQRGGQLGAGRVEVQPERVRVRQVVLPVARREAWAEAAG